ncbi:MAG: hypothetical protein JSV31_26365 [Desulfobacterales bacterium]|nr:MAG: hypothetical protein JSV31_26365 [Desulfobacterales bacterium]
MNESNEHKPRLRFNKNRIQELAERYDYAISEEEIIGLIPYVQKKGYLDKKELYKAVYWKSPRIAAHVKRNDYEFVLEITSFALNAKSEKSRIEPLTLLKRASWPVASVVLHFFHKDPYPIIDFRALWSISLEPPSFYNGMFLPLPLILFPLN